MTHPLFRDLTERDLREARPHVQFVGAEAGSLLIAEGEADPCLLALLSGEVEISRAGFLADTAGAGELVGEMAVFTDRTRGATVMASEPCRMVLIDRDGYEGLRDTGNPLAYNLERAAIADLGRRLAQVNRRVSRLCDGVVSPYERKPEPTALRRMLDRVIGPRRLEVSREPAPIDRVPLLAASALFADAPSEDLAVLAARFGEASFARGALLCTQGEVGDQMYLLARGTVDVVVACDGEPDTIHPLGTMKPGAAFGLSALLEDRPRRASCVAFEPVDALVLDRRAFATLVAANSPAASTFRRAIIRAFAEQLEEASSSLVTSWTRIAQREPLLELARAGVTVDVTARLAS